MNLHTDALANVLLISLESLFDATHRQAMLPTSETGEVRSALMDAYFDGFTTDPETPLIWLLRAWMGQGYPVVMYTKLPERMRPIVAQRLREAMPDIDWSEWPNNIRLHMPDYRGGFYGPAVVMDAVIQCREWGGVAVAHIESRNQETVRKWFPNAVINMS